MHGDPALDKGCSKQIALNSLKAVCEAVKLSVLRRKGDRFESQVDAARTGCRQSFEQEKRDAAAAGAEVKDPGRRIGLQ